MRNESAVVVLGMKFNGENPPEELVGRLDMGVRTVRENSSKYLILTGGKTNSSLDFSEAEGMKRYVESNYPKRRFSILLEEKAMDTIGNGIYSSAIIRGLEDVGEVILVTSCYHEDRSLYIFKKCIGDEISLSSQNCYSSDSPNAGFEKEKMFLAQLFFRMASQKGKSPADYHASENPGGGSEQ